MPSETSSKALFLDIDGVLWTPRVLVGHNRKSYRRIDHPLDPVMINFIDRMCATLRVRVVISSTHRLLRDRAELVEWLSPLGDHFHPDYKTKRFGGRPRGEEIQDWLDRHPETTHYAILDDDSDMLDRQKDYFVGVKDSSNGPTLDNMTHLWELFREPDQLTALDRLQ